MNFITVSTLIDKLIEFRDMYGDLPILLTVKQTDNGKPIMNRMTNVTVMEISKEDMEGSQRIISFSSYKLRKTKKD